MMCDHSGTYSGATRYLRDSGELRLVLLCDRCGAERQELGRVDYRPDPEVERARLAAGGSTFGGASAVALP
jgi:hypothetical protein